MTTRPTITVLTDPILTGREIVPEAAHRLARYGRDRLPRGELWYRSEYRGHFAVTRSVVEGMRKAGIPARYNPLMVGSLSETVVVLAGVRTLRQAVEFKRRGIVKRVLAGPNIVVFASDNDFALAAPEIDVVVTPCDWVVQMYREDIDIPTDRIWAWPAGVDTDVWKPAADVERYQVLIYEKQAKGPVGPVAPYADYLRSLGERVNIIRYGEYTHAEFLSELQKSKLMVGFVTDESQGLAWAEAWSADVPTLIWRNEENVHRGRRYHCSTAPYLTDATGLFFDDLDDFKQQLARWMASRDSFTPRMWTLSNMSDEVCARALYDKAVNC